MNISDNQKWVGLLEVSQNAGVKILGVERGVFVTAIVWCSSAEIFRSLVSEVLAESGLTLEEMEDVETCNERARKSTLPEVLIAPMKCVGPENPVESLEFYTFSCSTTK